MKQGIDHILLYAAGFGTRMGVLTQACPKPLLKVNGQSMLDRSLEIATASGLTNIAINTHFLADQVSEAIRGRGVVQAHEPEILETGGGLKAAFRGVAGPVATLNTDTIWIGANPITQLLDAWRDDDQALLLLVPREGADFAMDGNGHITRGGDWVYTGAQIIRMEHFTNHPEQAFSTNVIWDKLIAEKSIRAIPYSGRWFDVGTVDQLRIAELALASHGA